ncbi:MAG: histidine kinase, partial [Oscillospiraceae bacterium]
MEEFRVNPEDILRKIKREDLLQNRGHLKIFFGYAAGVGKTYAMLKAARAAQSHGTEVLVGYVEPHTRPQTTALLEGLTVLPSLVVIHKGIGVKEFDLDAAIAKKPKLILVDELAHTNAQSCRHKKRYQD